MNTLELQAARIAQGKDANYMSNVIGKTYASYIKKEKGKVKFSPEEMAKITNDLCLSPASQYVTGWINVSDVK